MKSENDEVLRMWPKAAMGIRMLRALLTFSVSCPVGINTSVFYTIQKKRVSTMGMCQYGHT